MRVRIDLTINFALLALLAFPLTAHNDPGAPPPPQEPTAPPAPVAPPAPLAPPPPSLILDGVSFADQKKVLYLPVRDMAASLECPLQWDRKIRSLTVAGKKVPRR